MNLYEIQKNYIYEPVTVEGKTGKQHSATEQQFLRSSCFTVGIQSLTNNHTGTQTGVAKSTQQT